MLPSKSCGKSKARQQIEQLGGTSFEMDWFAGVSRGEGRTKGISSAVLLLFGWLEV